MPSASRSKLLLAAALLLGAVGIYLSASTGTGAGREAADHRASEAASPWPAVGAAPGASIAGEGGLPSPEAIRSDPVLAREYVAAADFCLDSLVEWAMASPGLETPGVDVFGGSHSCEKLVHTYRGKHRTMLEQLKKSTDPTIRGAALTLQYQDLVAGLPGGGELPAAPSSPEMEAIQEHLREVEQHSNPCDLPALMRLALAQRLAGKGPMGSRELLLVYESANLLFPGDELVQAGIQLASEGLGGSETAAVKQAATQVSGNCTPGGLLPDLQKLR